MLLLIEAAIQAYIWMSRLWWPAGDQGAAGMLHLAFKAFTSPFVIWFTHFSCKEMFGLSVAELGKNKVNPCLKYRQKYW